MNHAEKVTAIAVLEIAMHDAMAAEARTNNAAIDAREAGATWEQIGRVLGITKQRAQQKYGHRTTPEAKAERERQAEQTDEMFFTETAAMLAEPDKKEPETTSIFLEPKAPAQMGESSSPRPLNDKNADIKSGRTNTAGEKLDWIEDAAHPRILKCAYCGQKNHISRPDRLFWIYPGCNITQDDQDHYDSGSTL